MTRRTPIRPAPHRIVARALIAALLAVGLGFGVRANDDNSIDPVRLGGLKALYLFQLPSHVDWPDGTFRGKDDPLVLGVIGVTANEPLGKSLIQLAAKKKAGGRAVQLKEIKLPPPDRADRPAQGETTADELRRCHMLYIGNDKRHEVPRLHRMLARSHVLTVSDVPAYARKGGMMGLIVVSGTIKVEIDRDAATAAGIRVSPRLLRMANKVYEKGS